MDENIFYQKKQVNISFQSSADLFFTFPTFFTIDFFFFNFQKKKLWVNFLVTYFRMSPKTLS